jgi:cytochrome c2
MLGGVFGRRAGSALDYAYSTALQQADITWSADNLDRWLAGPREFIQGAKMPVRVADPLDRRDIIAYLREESGEEGRQPAHASIARTSSIPGNQ